MLEIRNKIISFSDFYTNLLSELRIFFYSSHLYMFELHYIYKYSNKFTGKF